MAKLDIEATFTAPEKVNIALVRADLADQANVFRILFEVSLALLSALIGVMLSVGKLERIHWAALVVLVIATATFLALTLRISRQMKP
jgi:hypothetical protein